MDIDIRTAEQAIRTTMIGALAAFEEIFPDFVGSADWREARAQVLSLGNHQIRTIKLNAFDKEQ